QRGLRLGDLVAVYRVGELPELGTQCPDPFFDLIDRGRAFGAAAHQIVTPGGAGRHHLFQFGGQFRTGFGDRRGHLGRAPAGGLSTFGARPGLAFGTGGAGPERKSTRLKSSYVKISYAAFCLKKKKATQTYATHCRSSPL